MFLSLGKKIRPGIFGKFLILMAVTGAAISAMLGLYWRNVAQPQFRNEFHNHIEYYQTLLTKDLGNPPDRSRAEAVGEKLHIGIRYESSVAGDDSWQTNLFPQNFDSKQVNKIRRGQSLTAMATPTGRLLIYMRFRQEIETTNILAVVGIVGVALFIAWLISRYLLKPIRELRAGMSAIEAGKLDFRLKARGSDELAGLERSFNSMTQNLETMLQDRDRLLADVSHELRSPLTRMKVALEFNTDKKTAKKLRGEIMAMQTIIAALLDTERLAAGNNLEIVRLDKLIAELCREHKIRFLEKKTGVSMSGSREKLKIAIRNIIENAQKHGAQPITLLLETDADFATIRIADSGAGISAAESEKVFLPFYRTSGAARRGYGLGLYMTKRIVESMRGTVRMLPAEKGAVVAVSLPLAK
jgi:signal transduction histidine kinase